MIGGSKAKTGAFGILIGGYVVELQHYVCVMSLIRIDPRLGVVPARERTLKFGGEKEKRESAF